MMNNSVFLGNIIYVKTKSAEYWLMIMIDQTINVWRMGNDQEFCYFLGNCKIPEILVINKCQSFTIYDRNNNPISVVIPIEIGICRLENIPSQEVLHHKNPTRRAYLMRVFKNRDLQWKVGIRFTLLWIFVFTIIFSRQESYRAGFQSGLQNGGYNYAKVLSDEQSNIVSPDADNNEVREKALEVVLVDNLPNSEEGAHFLKVTVKRKDRNLEIHAYKIPVNGWETTLIDLVKDKFNKGVVQGH